MTTSQSVQSHVPFLKFNTDPCFSYLRPKFLKIFSIFDLSKSSFYNMTSQDC